MHSSNLVWLVFEGSISTCTYFHSENFFVTCPVVVVVFFFWFIYSVVFWLLSFF